MGRSKLTTLCYIEKDGAYLMLHRVKKEKDVNKDKWIGIGGHFEEESGGMSFKGGKGGDRSDTYLLPLPRAGYLFGSRLGYGIHVSLYSGQV